VRRTPARDKLIRSGIHAGRDAFCGSAYRDDVRDVLREQCECGEREQDEREG
jgi:hypothetical protein